MRRRTGSAGKRLTLNEICGLKRHNRGKWGIGFWNLSIIMFVNKRFFIIKRQYNMLVDNDKSKPMTGEIFSMQKFENLNIYTLNVTFRKDR